MRLFCEIRGEADLEVCGDEVRGEMPHVRHVVDDYEFADGVRAAVEPRLNFFATIAAGGRYAPHLGADSPGAQDFAQFFD